MIAGLDIGGTKIACGLVDDAGRVADRRQCPTNPEQGFEEAFGRISAMLASLAQDHGEIQGIGIGCTGPVDPRTGIIGSAPLVPGSQGTAIVERLEDPFGVPAAKENDADAVA